MTITFSSSDSKHPAPPSEVALAAEPGDSRDGVIRLKRRRTRRSSTSDTGVCVILLGPEQPPDRLTKAERWTRKVVDHVATAGAAPLAKDAGSTTTSASDPTRWYAFDSGSAGIHLAV